MRRGALIAIGLCACSSPPIDPTPTPDPGVVFTYPIDGQLDVPVGARLVVSFSDAEAASTACTVVGPDGPVELATEVTGGGKTLLIEPTALEAGTTYAIHVGGNALVDFTTRSDRPRAGAPSLIAFNGSPPDRPGELRPVFETSTIQLVFSEPLDPRSVTVEPGAIELVDMVTGAAIPATLIARGIHVTLDPHAPLAAGATYELRTGDRLVDLGGESLTASTVTFTPLDSLGRGPTDSTFRTRHDGDPGAAVARVDAGNVIALEHPMVGATKAAMKPAVIASQLGDPMALGGPIAFHIPRGQRLASDGLDIELAGAVPSGLSTGDIAIELIADGGGRIYRNRYRPAEQLPHNDHSPLHVDLSLDLAIYATDPTGNAVLSQTVLGVQISGVAIADEGVLAIETLGAIDIGLLGIAAAPTNLVLDLISAPGESAPRDTQAPALLSSLPAADSSDLSPDTGIELAFDEPIDLDRARAGGIKLVNADNGAEVATTLEMHGAVIVVRPRDQLPDNARYHVELADVADTSGNAMQAHSLSVATPAQPATEAPMSVVSVYPGTACSLVDPSGSSMGRCAGGGVADDRYHPFSLGANERIEIAFDQPADLRTIRLGTECGDGSVRIEHIDETGACLGAVAGTLTTRLRSIAFVPDEPWHPGERYRLLLVSGPDATCSEGEMCGANGKPASFDPLAGKTGEASGGPDLVIDFYGTEAKTSTTLFADVSPYSDLNASGFLEAGEAPRDENRAALRIAGTSGVIGFASFTQPDCVPETEESEACMYMLGAMPAELGERRDNCTLPDGTVAASCIPVTLSAQQMYSTSVPMTAGAMGIGITTETGISVMRVRERPNGPLEGFIVEREGKPYMTVALDLYMDAPDMHLSIGTHDMQSKPLAVALEGPLSFLPDGRIAIALRNTADVPISVKINAPFGINGSVHIVVPKDQMKLQLLSRPQRGRLP